MERSDAAPSEAKQSARHKYREADDGDVYKVMCIFDQVYVIQCKKCGCTPVLGQLQSCIQCNCKAVYLGCKKNQRVV
jgi:hypothetical protein